MIVSRGYGYGSGGLASRGYGASLSSQQLKYWNGTTWVAGQLKRWNGSTWASATLKRWNGSSWI